MHKKTQLYVGIGAVVVVGYLLLKKKPTTKAYAGTTETDVVGRRQRADGLFPKPKTIYAPKTDSIFRADGKPYKSMPYKPSVESLVVMSADGTMKNCDPMIDKNCRKGFRPEKSFFRVKDSIFGW